MFKYLTKAVKGEYSSAKFHHIVIHTITRNLAIPLEHGSINIFINTVTWLLNLNSIDEQEVRQGRRAAQNSQPQLDAEEDVLDAALGDMAETDNIGAPTDLDQV